MMTTPITFAPIPSPGATVVLDVGLLAVIALLAVGTLLVFLLRGARPERREDPGASDVPARAFHVERAA